MIEALQLIGAVLVAIVCHKVKPFLVRSKTHGMCKRGK